MASRTRSRVGITQHLTATIALGGPEPVSLDTHGTGGPGSLITVTCGSVAIWLHDRRAAECYAAAWLDGVAAETNRYLPAARSLEVRQGGASYPVIAVHAKGWDRVAGTYNPVRKELMVRVGYLTWLVYDRAAYDMQVRAWSTVRDLARIVLPEPGPDERP